MSCSPFNEFISSPHFNEPFEFITPGRIGDLVQPDFSPTFNPFQVEQSNLDIIEVIHPNLQSVEPLDADALLERLDGESEQEDVEEVVEMDPIEVLETSSCNNSVVELVHEEDDGRLPALSEASHLDLQKKQRNTLESLRRPFFKVIQVIVILNSLRIEPFMLVLVAYFRRVMATFLQGCAGEGKVREPGREGAHSNCHA